MSLKEEVEKATTSWGQTIEEMLADKYGRRLGYVLMVFESNGPVLSYRSTGRPELMAALLKEIGEKLAQGAGRILH